MTVKIMLKREEKKEKNKLLLIILIKKNDDDGYNDEAENGKAKDLGNLVANANRRDDNERLNDN